MNIYCIKVFTWTNSPLEIGDNTECVLLCTILIIL